MIQKFEWFQIFILCVVLSCVMSALGMVRDYVHTEHMAKFVQEQVEIQLDRIPVEE